jgi:DNA anti-recombination protein RmuC
MVWWQQAKDDYFFPRTAEGWISIGRSLLFAFAFVGGLGARWVLGKINATSSRLDEQDAELKERIEGIARGCAANTQGIADLQRVQQAAEFDRAQMHRDIGGVNATLEKMAQLLEKRHDERSDEYKELLRDVSQIKANMNIAVSLDKGLEKLVDVLNNRR